MVAKRSLGAHANCRLQPHGAANGAAGPQTTNPKRRGRNGGDEVRLDLGVERLPVDDDLRRFAALLHRFTADFETANQDALTERVSARAHAHTQQGRTD